jgi:ATP-dependent DNA helicase DinG
MLVEAHAARARIADIVALIPARGGALLCDASGALRHAGIEESRKLFRSGDVLIAHTAFVSGRLRTPPSLPLFDVMELFTFVRPAQPCVPSALGLARALALEWPKAPEDSARTLRAAAMKLLDELRVLPEKTRLELSPLIGTLARSGWRWADAVRAAIDVQPDRSADSPIAGLNAWRTLKPWEDEPSPGKPSSHAVSASEAHARLKSVIGEHGEARPEQEAYVDAALYAFAPRERIGAPRVALVEAGTGTGKTLGYLAPASLWAEKNGPGLWISTYTRNLQRQILQEIARLYPDPAERDEKAVLRKGRENYLCLLNFEEAARRTALAPGQRAVALALIARWISATQDGDVSGVGFPAFLGASLALREITDRRGECIYAACSHYRTCFIERAVRRARTAPIVIANHALVIAQAAGDAVSLDETNDGPPERRVRYVLDEGHHLFDAADSGFAALLSGVEMGELRRWIRGPEGRGRSRHRGLSERLNDLVKDDPDARAALDDAVHEATILAGDGWMSRIHNGVPHGPGEVFLSAAHEHVRARTTDSDALYSLEAETQPLSEELAATARTLSMRLKDLAHPLAKLAHLLRALIATQSDELDTAQRARIEAAARGLERRARIILPAWASMLDALDSGDPKEFADWFEIEREDGRDVDVGLRRHWIDPTIPLASEVIVPSHGALITSATLRDSSDAEDWASADVRTGANHLAEPARRASFGSPFRYAEQSRVFIIRDVNRRDVDQLAAAYRELFLASGGGALGLFTAVRALRNVERRIGADLADAGITLYSQHVDRLDTGALVDLFRSEENACLLGTDALRDGVDVPGRSLRLAVFDKVPWPKPTILHKARRARFGRFYDDQLTRLRLKQAFGRLIRSERDKGCFVILEPATPSRLLTAFPPDAPVQRCGLAETVAEIREFLSEPP